MTTLFGLAEDHCPFMQTKTAVKGCARRDRPAEFQTEGEAARLCFVRQAHPDMSVGTSQETAVSDEFVRLGQRDAGTRRPTPDGREAKRIIGEEKIFDGVALALLRPRPTGLDESIRTGLMRRATGPPFRGTEHDLTGRLDAQSKRR